MDSIDLINITDTQSAETNVDWMADGERADEKVLNRPVKEVAAFVNLLIENNNNFATEVSAQMGENHIGIPDLRVSFNDGIEVEYGNGYNDQIDVSAAQDGSIMVDLPSKKVSYSRAGTCNWLNKSGELVEYAEDEPVITDKGIFIHRGFANILEYSEDFTQDSWAKRSLSDLEYQTTDTKDPMGGYNATKQIATSDDQENGTYVAYQDAFPNDDTIYTASIFVKKGTETESSITMFSKEGTESRTSLAYDFDTDEVVISNYGNVEEVNGGRIICNDGWVFLWCSANMLTGTNTTGVRFSASNWSPSISGYSHGFLYGAQISGSLTARYYPYLKTEGGSNTCGATSMSIPTRSNFPAQGKNFTYVLDCEFNGNITSLNSNPLFSDCTCRFDRRNIYS